MNSTNRLLSAMVSNKVDWLRMLKVSHRHWSHCLHSVQVIHVKLVSQIWSCAENWPRKWMRERQSNSIGPRSNRLRYSKMRDSFETWTNYARAHYLHVNRFRRMMPNGSAGDDVENVGSMIRQLMPSCLL